ncbi:MAG: hypothetical protein DMF68_20375 [Acidobacteria bacterium]|nr:MAG: hypothetical protein DMF68_20375 [Acidobacteriota bacterium]
MMNREQNAFRSIALFSAAIFLSGFVSASAQRLSAGSHAGAESTSKRVGNRRLVKIRTRAGDTLSLLGDRFGATAEEIASLNNFSVNAKLQPGQEILIPLPSPEMLAKTPADNSVPRNEEEDGEWVNVQGVLFRKGSATRAVETSKAVSIDNNVNNEPKEKTDATQVKIVNVSEADRSTATQPVWIYLVGGARVEADSVNETADGVWYKRGPLTIFIERSHVERIERERAKETLDATASWTERGWTTGNAKFDGLIKENGARFGVDPYLIFCVMEQESQFKPWVVSPKGARGLMQLMPGTAARFGVRRPLDPAENIMGGTRYLKMLLDNFNGRVDLVLAGYNAGEGAVMRFGGNVPPFRETRNYVQRISKRYGQDHSFAPGATKETASAPTGNQ